MVDAIQLGKHKELVSAPAIFQIATGQALVTKLLENLHKAEVGDQVEQPPEEILNSALEVMDEHTARLDTHHAVE